MASNRVINFQLVNSNNRGNISVAGGEVMICAAGSPRKLTLVDSAGAALANPVSFTRGQIYAEVAKANITVDLYIRAPSGHFRVIKGMRPGSIQSVQIDTLDSRTTYVVPFSFADSVAATEKDSGFDLVQEAQVMPEGVGVEIFGTDAGITIEAGILSTESGGDADGFIDAVSCATAGMVKTIIASTTGVIASATSTIGVLISEITNGTNADDRGYGNKKAYRCDGTAKSLSYTLLVAADTAEGFLIYPVEFGGVVAAS